MPWYGWAVVALVIASSLTTVGAIGKPRGPIEPSIAVVMLVTNALFGWAILALGGVV